MDIKQIAKKINIDDKNLFCYGNQIAKVENVVGQHKARFRRRKKPENLGYFARFKKQDKGNYKIV